MFLISTSCIWFEFHLQISRCRSPLATLFFSLTPASFRCGVRGNKDFPRRNYISLAVVSRMLQAIPQQSFKRLSQCWESPSFSSHIMHYLSKYEETSPIEIRSVSQTFEWLAAEAAFPYFLVVSAHHLEEKFHLPLIHIHIPLVWIGRRFEIRDGSFGEGELGKFLALTLYLWEW